jgi:hypothetical protein
VTSIALANTRIVTIRGVEHDGSRWMIARSATGSPIAQS